MIRKGQLRIKDGDIGNYEDMLYMDWFVDNVVGELPVSRIKYSKEK